MMPASTPSTNMETGETRQTTEAAVKESATAVAVASATTATSSSSIPNNVDDAESATDEVKVYGEEDGDERETKAFEGGQARDPLLDDKSTLLTESEQSKDARRHDLTHSHGRLFDPVLSSLAIHDNILRAAMDHQKIEEIPVPREKSSHEDSDGGHKIPKILINSVELDDQQDGEEIAKSSTTNPASMAAINTAQLHQGRFKIPTHQGQVYEGMYCSILTIFY